MNHSKDIADYLATQGIGTVGTSIFYDGLDDAPDDAVGVYSYGGRSPLIIGGIDRPSVNVRCRSASQVTANNKAQSIDTVLRQVGDEYNQTAAAGVTINGTLYLRIVPIQPPFTLGRDTQGRIEYSQNFQIDVRR